MPSSRPPVVPRATARRLFLDAQGLLDDPARSCTPDRLCRTIERMGFVQIDSINAVARAHHLTLGARFDGYRAPALARLLEVKRRLFEHWTHDAAAIPTRWYPHWHHRFAIQRRRIEGSRWWRERLGRDPRALLARVERRIRDAGPVLAKDFLAPAGTRNGRKSGWWEWRPEKAALEYLWHTGRLAVVRREGFQKVYDLVERVLPAEHALAPPSPDAHLEWAARSALDRLGVATPREIAAFWDLLSADEAAAWCAARVKAGDVVAVRVDGADAAFAPADWERRSRRVPDPPDRIRLLGPFDPIVRDRRRALRRFGFDYRFEAFVPAAQRVHGYYVLPMLERDRLVGRIEPTLDRQTGVLAVRGVWWDPGVRPTRARRAALDAALERLAALAGARAIRRDGRR